MNLSLTVIEIIVAVKRRVASAWCCCCFQCLCRKFHFAVWVKHFKPQSNLSLQPLLSAAYVWRQLAHRHLDVVAAVKCFLAISFDEGISVAFGDMAYWRLTIFQLCKHSSTLPPADMFVFVMEIQSNKITCTIFSERFKRLLSVTKKLKHFVLEPAWSVDIRDFFNLWLDICVGYFHKSI